MSVLRAFLTVTKRALEAGVVSGDNGGSGRSIGNGGTGRELR